MLYKIDKVEDKSKDWKVITGLGVDGTPLFNASVNRVNKKGETFPNFDGIVEGASVEGEPWASDSGKQYLFAPREKKQGGARRGGADPVAIAQAQEHKAENIRMAQDNKDQAIRLSGAMNHAVNVVTTFSKDLTPEEIKSKIINWRNWFLENWDIENKDSGEIPF